MLVIRIIERIVLCFRCERMNLWIIKNVWLSSMNSKEWIMRCGDDHDTMGLLSLEKSIEPITHLFMKTRSWFIDNYTVRRMYKSRYYCHAITLSGREEWDLLIEKVSHIECIYEEFESPSIIRGVRKGMGEEDIFSRRNILNKMMIRENISETVLTETTQFCKRKGRINIISINAICSWSCLQKSSNDTKKCRFPTPAYTIKSDPLPWLYCEVNGRKYGFPCIWVSYILKRDFHVKIKVETLLDIIY